jgi:hypothetical protein
MASHDENQEAYLSYLLRLWRAGDATLALDRREPIWRASLEHPHTGERVGFASLEDLLEYLQHQTGQRTDG